MEDMAREAFVSEIVEHSLKASGYDAHLPIASAIKDAILRDVLIDDDEWESARKTNVDSLNLSQTRADLEHFLRSGIEFFPVEHITESDLGVVIAALRIKFRPAHACVWPIKNGYRSL
ncbi:hypothetical protein ACIO7M_05380 [Streptomyces toxytricini]|uniref:Uncharacterized protein n=1 Tax=Streptomyces toxytricini TaxID=67369 RepID=A0ABW8EED1_STRT5